MSDVSENQEGKDKLKERINKIAQEILGDTKKQSSNLSCCRAIIKGLCSKKMGVKRFALLASILVVLTASGLGLFTGINELVKHLAPQEICSTLSFAIVVLTITIAILCFQASHIVRHFRKKCGKCSTKEPYFLMRDFLYLNMNFLETFTAQKDGGFAYDTKLENGSVSSVRIGTNYISFDDTDVKREVRSMRQREEMLNGLLGSKLESGDDLVKKIDSREHLAEIINHTLKNETDRPKLENKITIQMLMKNIVAQRPLCKTKREMLMKEIFSLARKNNMTSRQMLLKITNEQILVKNIVDQVFLNKEGNKSEKLLVKALDASISKELKDSIGNYVCLKTYFDFISLSRLENLTNQEAQYRYLPENDILTTEDSSRIRQIRKNIALLKTLFPFDSFLTAKNVIVLMENDPLRELNSQIGYKFNSNNLVVVGKVYKKISDIRVRSAPANQTLDNLQRLTLSLLRKIGVIRKEDAEIYFITPIAIYSEQSVLRESK